ncbi:hypothetical protein [Flavobacterium sp. KACC 22761]|uniref:hypothetical protein n=1 Tax=Flavobacterium sp. KACC 22761 TaxID=3092665 RepID=UPI002A750B59|nr:hypothetical protein [Flavobacterium sp. KACC 22761]WPO80238.1 hypothetical protein SCB73_07600 [Flavobacterium sp. KACC 22761]
MKYIFSIIFFSLLFISNAQSKYYNYNIYDGKDYLFTMSQSNDLMLNSIRYIGQEINNSEITKKEEKLYSASLLIFTSLIGQALTHEAGHKSVLSELGIGSVSKPFFDKNLVAKVTGVTDESLINLRDNNLPNYIRLHTAGLESDYAYLRKSDMYFNFNEESYKVLYPDYLMRKLGAQLYYFSSFYNSTTRIKETDSKELNRDVVGNDVYGMIRHLHRPSMEFYRYTQRKDLTDEEKSYAKRIGYFSLINFLNPNIWKLGNYKLSKDVVGNFSVNYSLAPFGYFTEQNAYLQIKDKYKINPYFRQYFNKSYTFFAGGLALHNYSFNDEKYLLNSSLDFWEQPKKLEFRAKEAEFGVGIKSEFAIRFSKGKDDSKPTTYFNLGMSYKTAGFIPEAPSLSEDFQVHLGIILSVKK